MKKIKQMKSDIKNIELKELLNYLSEVNYHTKLDILSLIPFLGQVIKIINAIWFMFERQFGQALISLLALIPSFGKYFLLPRIISNINSVIKQESASEEVLEIDLLEDKRRNN